MSWLRDALGKAGAETPAQVAVPPEAAAPGPQDPPEVWVEAVCNASDKVLASAWAAQVEGDACLAEIAIRGRFAETRLAAAQRIADSAVLKRVAEASRDKDKLVYRHCSDALRAHRQGDERARRAPDLERALEALLEGTPLAISHLLLIEKDIAALGADTGEFARCAELLVQAQARVLQETQAQIDLRGLLSEAEALRGQVLAAESAGEQALTAWRERAAELAQRAAAAPAWLAQLPAARALSLALRDTDARFAVLEEQSHRLAASEADRLAAEALQLAEQEAQAQAPPPAAVVAQPPARKPIDRDLVQGLLETLEKQLEEGQLAEADTAAAGIERALEGASLSGNLGRRLQRAQAQQTRLHGWARWGTEQARAHLIAAAEALLRGEPDLAERARAVPLLRVEWKRLDAHGAASRGLWFRFDSALARAYKPVAEHRAAESARHEVARAVKRSLCEEWAAWLEQQGETPADAVVLGAKRDEMLARWRAAESADYRDERKLRKRLDALLAKIDARLEQGREAEIARREALVLAAQALSELPDAAQAINAAKSLQRRWKDEASAARIGHGKDRKLWERFRTACDAVFARREAEQAGRAAQRAQQVEAHKTLLDGFEAAIAAADGAPDGGALKQALAQVRATLAGPPSAAGERHGATDSRGRGAASARRNEDAARRGVDAARRGVDPARRGVDAARRNEDPARRNVDPARRNEDPARRNEDPARRNEDPARRNEDPARRMAEPRGRHGENARTSDPRQAPVDPRARDLMRRAEHKLEALEQVKQRARFERMGEKAALAQNTAAPSPELLAKGKVLRDELLLDLEIALELPTPESHAAARHAHMLKRLQGHFRGDAAAASDPEALISRWYSTAAEPNPEQGARLASAIDRLLDRGAKRAK